MRIFFIIFLLITNISFSYAENIHIDVKNANIENEKMKIEFNLSNGTYSCINKLNNVVIIKDAQFHLCDKSYKWKTPKSKYYAEKLRLDNKDVLRVWFVPLEGYYLTRFLDVSIDDFSNAVRIGWGVKNDKQYVVRVNTANVLYNGKLFSDQKPTDYKILRGGAGAEPNVVENTWKIESFNNIMLTYIDKTSNKRITIVTGGGKYSEFFRTINCNDNDIKGNIPSMTLSVKDSYGKNISPGILWKSKDDFYLDFITTNPFDALDNYGIRLAQINNANPNRYNFPTLCGWMVSTKHLGEGKPINNSVGLVEQMKLANKSDLGKFTKLAVRLEPDYYCYSNYGDTQQGWWDDEHWSKYRSLVNPYNTFKKFCDEIKNNGGNVFTYFQTSMPSNDFAIQHKEWMLNKDISLIHMDHRANTPFVRYDYTNSDFQNYMLKMWRKLRNSGVVGIKFDYPESAWSFNGGFVDKSYTTVSAYRKVFELCREGMGKDAFIHERILGQKPRENVPCTDVTAGVVDIQRVWGDASHFEPKMAARIGLRWYKQAKVFRYYPDGKSFYFKGIPLSTIQRRNFLSLISLLSGRIELGTSLGSMDSLMISDLTKVFPTLPNGKTFKPIDLLFCNEIPSIYTYDVNSAWKQIIFVNNLNKDSIISANLSGNQCEKNSLGCDEHKKYIIFDFWNKKPLGIFEGNNKFIASLKPQEVGIYSLRELKKYPQIIGTDRNLMCGMFEISDEKFNKNTLDFNIDIEAKSEINVFIHSVRGKNIKKVIANDLQVITYKDNDYYTIKLSNDNKEKCKQKVKIIF